MESSSYLDFGFGPGAGPSSPSLPSHPSLPSLPSFLSVPPTAANASFPGSSNGEVEVSIVDFVDFCLAPARWRLTLTLTLPSSFALRNSTVYLILGHPVVASTGAEGEVEDAEFAAFMATLATAAVEPTVVTTVSPSEASMASSSEATSAGPRTVSPSEWSSVSSASLLRSSPGSEGVTGAVTRCGRRAKSCTGCKGSKTKCEGGSPCRRCKRMGKTCVFEDGPPRTRGKGKKTLALEETQAELEAMMASLQEEEQALARGSQRTA
ncbi:unnamed protein product [Parajaminaea phylloscopi]